MKGGRAKRLWVLAVALLLFAGCTGGGGKETAPAGGGGEESGGAEVVEEGTTTAPEAWCTKGSYWSWVNPQTGESARLVVQGIEEHKGRKTCKAVLEGRSGGSYAKWESYFSESGDYSDVLFYDEQGRLRAEWEIEGNKMTFREYDEQGNVVNEFTMGEGGMQIPGMGMPTMPGMPGQ